MDPLSELLPLGQTDCTLAGKSLFDTPKSSTQAETPSMAAGGQEEPKESVTEICKEHSVFSLTKEMNCSSQQAGGEPGRPERSPNERCLPPGASSRTHSLAETASHQHRIVVNANSDPSHSGKTSSSIKAAALPVYRSHSDASPLAKQAAPPHGPDGAHRGRDRSVREAESRSMLPCKQPMQLQQCNIVTTVCRGANGGEGVAQPLQSRCICCLSPKAAVTVEVEQKGHLPPKCEKVLCYGSYIHHANFEDTFAAYCHPQPIPAHSQLLPRLAGMEPAAPPASTNHLTLPRLISSVSETGLDGKHLLRCCNLNCSLMSSLPPATVLQKHFSEEECCSGASGHVRATTRDAGTMTAHRELRDVGVQTGQSVTPHVFPQIWLSEDNKRGTPCRQTSNAHTDGGKKQSGGPKSPVKEVKWDAEGMTWEVYGASVDPEELGVAIQKHLELQIRETASRAAKLSRQNTNTSRQSGNASCQRKRSRIMGYIRTPSCCARTTTAVD